MDLIRTPKVENVRMLDRYNSRKITVGTLYLTATHLIFVDPEVNRETWILHMHIGSVEKLPLTTEGSPLAIRCKTFLSVTFIIPRERDCHDVYNTLHKLSQPSHYEELYCFRYTSSCEDIPKNAGWTFFDLQAEYQRMRVPNDQWVLTLINQHYKLCDTYPAYLYVPIKTTQSILIGSSKFRSKGRLPVLSYLHKNKAAICRCSQPLSGFNARCLEDEQMLNCILNTNPNSKYMFVVDTRPRINAMANRATGKGYENENFYENIKFHFLGIENIHVMRNSLIKLIETCELKVPTMSAFLNGLESSGWMKHIKSILDTSYFIAQAVEAGISVLVHCSDGWDRTAQVCSLASILLDPYYRSIQGFQALIEKEWLSFGHKFTDRVGHLSGDTKEISPIFTQFIDCTWQLTQQFPLEFQFNDLFLFTLHDHVSSCQFGTFIGNFEKERFDLRLKEKTFSLWGYMANHMREYMNSLYQADVLNEILRPNMIPQNIRFWRGMYCRFECGIHPRENIGDLLLAASGHSESLEEHIKFVKKKMRCCFKTKKITRNPFLKEKLNYGTKQFKVDNDVLFLLKGSFEAPPDRVNKPGGRLERSCRAQIQFTLGDIKKMQGPDVNVTGPAAILAKSYHGSRLGDKTHEPYESLATRQKLIYSYLRLGYITSVDHHTETGIDNNYYEVLAALNAWRPKSVPAPVSQLVGLGEKDDFLNEDVYLIALDWKSLRNVKMCVCTMPFDHFTKKYHCWQCGYVFCIRCIDRHISLPGHLSQCAVPVCQPCYQKISYHSPWNTP